MTDTRSRASQTARRIAVGAAFGLAGLALTPNEATAQWGVAGGVRTAKYGDGPESVGGRNGFEGRLFLDRTLPSVGEAERFAIRGEVAYNQMQYDRNQPGANYQVAENSFEFLVAARAEFQGALTGGYVTAGPVASFRTGCGTLGGNVACAEGDSYLTGYALGAGFTWPATRANVLIELRYLGNVTAANGQQLLAISVGLSRKRSQ